MTRPTPAVPTAVPAASARNPSPTLPGLAALNEAPTTLRSSQRFRSMSPRDHSTLNALGTFRLLTGGQIQRLLFREGSDLTRSRRARRSLARLTDNGLIQRQERQIGGVHGGSSGFTYSLTGFGQRLLGGRGPAGGSRRRSQWPTTPAFGDHLIAVAEVYIRLVEAQAEGGAELLTFEAEPKSWRRWTGMAGESRILKPDAYAALGSAELEQLWFIEVDRGTESSLVVDRQCRAYLAYFDAGLEQEREGVFPSVLWIVPDDKRATALLGLLARLPPPADSVFRVATASQALAILLDPIRLTTNP